MKGNSCCGSCVSGRGGLGHLHQREQALLHARAADGGEADEGQLLLDGGLDAAHEALADHRAHRAAHELELESGHDHRHGLERALHHDQGIGFAGVFLASARRSE